MSNWGWQSRDAMIAIDPHWVAVSEVAAVVDDMDNRYAPPQRKGTRVLLRNGVWLAARKSAAEILDLMKLGLGGD